MTPRNANNAGVLARLIITGLAITGFGVTGCARRPAGGDQPMAGVSAEREPRVSVEEIAAKYNVRVAGIDRLWARAVTSVTYRDEQGKPRREQGDGHFMFVEPGRFALTMGAPHRTMLHFGAGETPAFGQASWIMDLIDTPTAFVAPEGARFVLGGEDTGAPLVLDPSDVLLLAGMRAFDPAKASLQAGTSAETVTLVRPLGDGRLLALELVESSGEPVGAELREASGETIVRSTLGTPERVLVRGGGIVPPYVPSVVEVSAAGDEEVGVRVSLSDPEISPRRPRDRVFDFEVLKATYNIEEVVDITKPRETRPRTDADAAPEAGGAGEP